MTVQVYPEGQWASKLLWVSSQDAEAGWGTKALGAPDVTFMGDSSHAWQPLGTGQYEFIHLEFANETDGVTGVMVRQTNGGGFVRRVELYEADGDLINGWNVADATAASIVDLYVDFPAAQDDVKSVRIVVDASSGTPNIDAVRLLTGGSASELTVSAWTVSGDGAQATFTVYNGDGLPTLQEEYGNGVILRTTESEYDAGVLTTATVTNTADQAVRKTFDDVGHVLTEVLAYGTAGAATTTYGYTEGLLTSLVDPLGNETNWEYDAKGREVLMTDPLGNDAVKTWDEEGRLASILNRNGLLRTFEYYDDGKLHYERWYDGATTAADLVRTFTWTYTASGQVATASVTDGVDTFTYSYQYNAAGQMIRVEEPFGVVVEFGYDPYGNRNLVRDSLGGEERSVYNASRQLLVRTLTQDGEELRLDFAYDAKGRVATIKRYSDLVGTQLVAVTSYGYRSFRRNQSEECLLSLAA